MANPYITTNLAAQGAPLTPALVAAADVTGEATRALRLSELRTAVLESIARDTQLAPARSGWARDLRVLAELVESNDAAVAVVARARGLAGAGASR